ncbi:site-specific DNA-methyltransferase, partial [Candidatus Poribacteria bacterium]|nr:site-specific DNA-methyltransferase [Candidatus Poribacteria bacterium]
MPKETFNEKLIARLKTHSDFIDESGELLPAAVKDRAWHLDHNLIKLLLTDEDIKSIFFDEIEGHWVFNHNTFIDYITTKNFLANSYTQFRNKIGLNIDGKFLRERGEVSLVWPYKDCVLEGGQTKEEEKRKEIFFNEILAHDEINQMFDPKVLTNWKRHTVSGEQDVIDIQRDENGTIRENLIIKGNNLIALHTLKQQFRGQVKLIYIDPPYNPDSPSNTFMYNNNFKRSSWLTFMKNRLDIAKELLRNDGSIIVAIDENEQNYLGVLLDEVFPEREKHCITIIHNPRGVQGTNFSYIHEYAFFVIPKGKKIIGDTKIYAEEITWNNLRNLGG